MRKRLINFLLPQFSELDVVLLLIAIIVTCGFYSQEVIEIISSIIINWENDNFLLLVVICVFTFFFAQILLKMILTKDELTLDEKRGAATIYYCLLGFIGMCAAYLSIASKTQLSITDVFVFYMLFRSIGSIVIIRINNRRNNNIHALQMNNMQLHIIHVVIGLIFILLANIYNKDQFFVTLVVAYSYASMATSLLGGVKYPSTT